MKQEIKDRIEQIKNGIVPEEYKNSEYGTVPTEWKDTAFSDLFSEKSEYTEDFNKYPLYTLSIEDGIISKPERYERGHLVKKEKAYKILPENYFAYNPMNARFGAISRNKTNRSVAVSGYYDIFTTKNSLDSLFMDDFLVSQRMISYYNRMATGSLVEKQRVHFSQFIQFMLPLPPFFERKKIAEILSTQDKVIELKEKLIEQKRQRKKYICQVIIERDNKAKKVHLKSYIEEVISRNNNQLINNVLSVNNQLGFVSQSEQFGKSVASKDTGNYKVVSYMDIAYNPSRINVGSVALKTELEKGIVSPMYNVFHTKEGLLPQYLMYFFETNTFYQQMKRALSGSVRDSLSLYDLGQIAIALPSKEKQQVIINVLGACDKEIKLLEQELEQEKQKKKALMQLLLTGIVRVKND